MQGRAFLDLAREVVLGNTEAHWRGTVVHAYYALLECRDALARWGRTPSPRDNVHSFVRLTLAFAGEQDLKAIADALDYLVRSRNKASYDLSPSQAFASAATARASVQQATDALALLDAIEADPARRASAIASLPP
jgi:hypothetical protein